MSKWLIEVISHPLMSTTDKFIPFWLDAGYLPHKGDFMTVDGKNYTVIDTTFYTEMNLIKIRLDSGLRRMP